LHYLFCPGGAFPAGFRFGSDTGGSAGAGAGSGAGTGSFSIAGLRVAAACDVVTAGADGGGTTGAVVGTGFVSDCAGRSPSLSKTVMDPKPTSSTATHASGSQTARLPIR
jgi:hypothetical protein